MSTRDLETRLGEWGRRELAEAERGWNPTAADPFARAAADIARRRLVVKTAVITTIIVLLLGAAAWRIAAIATSPDPTPTAAGAER